MTTHVAVVFRFGTGHGECNVHLLRYLKKNTEETGNGWSGKMSNLLARMNRKGKEAIGGGEKGFSHEEVEKYREEYRELIRKGRGGE